MVTAASDDSSVRKRAGKNDVRGIVLGASSGVKCVSTNGNYDAQFQYQVHFVPDDELWIASAEQGVLHFERQYRDQLDALEQVIVSYGSYNLILWVHRLRVLRLMCVFGIALQTRIQLIQLTVARDERRLGEKVGVDQINLVLGSYGLTDVSVTDSMGREQG